MQITLRALVVYAVIAAVIAWFAHSFTVIFYEQKIRDLNMSHSVQIESLLTGCAAWFPKDGGE